MYKYFFNNDSLKKLNMILKKNISEFSIFFVTIILILNSADPVLETDSVRYLNQSLLDPPLYSSFIFISQLIFGSLKYVVILQTIFVAFAIIFFTKTLTQIFDLGSFDKTLISLFLFLPVISIYKNILTETISYTFSLLFISFMAKLIYNFNNKNLAWLSITAIALLITRNQFLFLYPIIFLLFLGLFFSNPDKQKIKLLTLSLILIFLTHNFLIILNTHLKKDIIHINKEYGVPEDIDIIQNTKWTEKITYVTLGPSYFLFIDALYVSNIEDVELFKNQNTKKLLVNIFNEMNEKKSLIKNYNGRGHFASSFSNIRDYSYPLLSRLAHQQNLSVSKLRNEISIKLIKKNYKIYIKFLIKKAYDTTWLFIVVPLLISLSGLIFFIKNKSNISLLLSSVSLFAISNHMVIYLFGRIQPRYFLYSDLILLVLLFMIVSTFLKIINKKKSNNF